MMRVGRADDQAWSQRSASSPGVGREVQGLLLLQNQWPFCVVQHCHKVHRWKWSWGMEVWSWIKIGLANICSWERLPRWPFWISRIGLTLRATWHCSGRLPFGVWIKINWTPESPKRTPSAVFVPLSQAEKRPWHSCSGLHLPVIHPLEMGLGLWPYHPEHARSRLKWSLMSPFDYKKQPCGNSIPVAQYKRKLCLGIYLLQSRLGEYQCSWDIKMIGSLTIREKLHILLGLLIIVTPKMYQSFYQVLCCILRALCGFSSTPDSSPLKQVLLLFSRYIWGNWDMERFHRGNQLCS